MSLAITEIQELKTQPQKLTKPLNVIKKQAEQYELEKHSNSIGDHNTNDILKAPQESNNQKLERKREKPFDPLGIDSGQYKLEMRSNSIDDHKNTIEYSHFIMKEMVLKSRNLAKECCKDKIKKLEEEKREIEKKLVQKELKPEVNDDEKQLEKSIKEIDEQIEKEIKAETDKMFGQMVAFYKTFKTIKETSKLTEKQFRQNFITATMQAIYGSFGNVDQGVQDLVKTLMKLLAEQKL